MRLLPGDEQPGATQPVDAFSEAPAGCNEHVGVTASSDVWRVRTHNGWSSGQGEVTHYI